MTVKIAVITFVSVCCTDASRAQAVESGNGLKLRENTFSIYGGMGISIADAPGLVKYLNTLENPTVLNNFATDVEFFGGAEFPLSFEWGGAVEYAYLFKSYSLSVGDAGTYTVFYSLHMPTAMVHYVITGEGYFLKFGGGIGYHTGSLEQKDPYGNDITYSAHGIGLKGQVVGQTAFDEHLYAYIGGDMRWELLGKLKSDNGTVLQNQGRVASLSMFVVGLNFGVVYYF
jgi:hypothetical protein